MGVVNLVLQSSLKTILGCFQMRLKISFGCFTMILRTANLRHGDLHRFDNCDFNNDFLRVRKWRFVNLVLQSSLRVLKW